MSSETGDGIRVDLSEAIINGPVATISGRHIPVGN